MSDLISRQKAIDAIEFEKVYMTAYENGVDKGNPLALYNKGLDDAIKVIKNAPTIEVSTKNLISRQNVVDALELGLDNDYVDATELLEYVKSLPSVEPEERTAKVKTIAYSYTVYDCNGECDNCGQSVDEEWDYCPSCGARLEWK